MNKHIFVTGGNGFIGSRVIHFLIEKGYQPILLLRPSSKTGRIAHLDYQTVIGDILDYSSLLKGMEQCEGVIHLASLSNWNDIASPLMAKIVIEGSKNLLKAAEEMGNLRMVYVSSSTAINGSDEPVIQNEEAKFTLDKKNYAYAWAKHQVEEICKNKARMGHPIIIVNPTEVYGPHDDNFITCGNLRDFAISNPVLVCSGGTSIVHVDDVAKGIVEAFEKGNSGERYILGGENYSVTRLAEETLFLLGQKKRIFKLHNRLILLLAFLGKTCRIPIPFNPHMIPYAVKYWYFDNSKAKKELGLTFRCGRDVLQETLEWMQKVK